MHKPNGKSAATLLLLCLTIAGGCYGHEAKDFDDSILYRIDFERPNFEFQPELKNQLRTFYTHEKEKYECVIPAIEEPKETDIPQEAELSPIIVLQPLFSSLSCSYRIEVYWSYEICHGAHVRQYHEEREGKNVKSQEYMLGKYNLEQQATAVQTWTENRKAGKKYKTIKIDNVKYPYYEIEMRDGSLCDIIDMPRTTIVKYVCYFHGKNEIYSFKETATCNYEAIILTPTLCIIPAFMPQESREVSIQCFTAPSEPYKPLSMLRQELSDMQTPDDDFPVSKETNEALAALARTVDRYMDKMVSLRAAGEDTQRYILDWQTGRAQLIEESPAHNADLVAAAAAAAAASSATPLDFVNAPISAVQIGDSDPAAPFVIWQEVSMLRQFISGKTCLTGGTGWWKYEFCYGRHVRQFHKDKKSETELFLGYFDAAVNQQWLEENPTKNTKTLAVFLPYLWHHYVKGTHCDRTNMPRDVDVKLNCVGGAGGFSSVSMYLLEPKTCHYILVVESPMICDMIEIADDYGWVGEEQLKMYETVRLSKWKKAREFVAGREETSGGATGGGSVDETAAVTPATTTTTAESVEVPNEDVPA